MSQQDVLAWIVMLVWWTLAIVVFGVNPVGGV